MQVMKNTSELCLSIFSNGSGPVSPDGGWPPQMGYRTNYCTNDGKYKGFSHRSISSMSFKVTIRAL